MALTFIHTTDTHITESPDSLVGFYGTAGAAKAVLKHIAKVEQGKLTLLRT